MLGVENFQPWTGVNGKYESSFPRVLVLGDAQLLAPLSDRDCILRRLRATPDLIFTNFDQAVLGKRHWERDYSSAVRAFWERTLFYNYNATHAGRPDAPSLNPAARANPLHAELLREMLERYKPTHVIVWGEDNWRAVAVAGAAWQEETDIPSGSGNEPCRSVVVAEHRTLFTRVNHPSAGFAYDRWSALLSHFLALPV